MKVNDLKNEVVLKQFLDKLQNKKYTLLSDKNDNLLVFIRSNCEQDCYGMFYNGYLNDIKITKNGIVFSKVLKCEYDYFDYGRKYLHLNLIKVMDKKYLGKGYGFVMLKYLEHLVVKNGQAMIQGSFVPLPGFDRKATEKFYKKNGYKIQYGGMDVILEKDVSQCSKIKTQNMCGLNIFKPFEKLNEEENIETN